MAVNVEEKHFTVQELAKVWGTSDTYVRRLFGAEPGVIKLQPRRVTGHRKAPRTMLRIPKSVAERVWRRSGGGELPRV